MVIVPKGSQSTETDKTTDQRDVREKQALELARLGQYPAKQH